MGEPAGYSALYRLDKDTLYNKCRYRKIPVSINDTKAYMARELALYEGGSVTHNSSTFKATFENGYGALYGTFHGSLSTPS